MLTTNRICILGILGVVTVVIIIVAFASPSVECMSSVECEGADSVCFDHYCQCQVDFPQGWQCRGRYLGFEYYRGYGSPYSGVLLLGLFLTVCLVCWFPCDPFLTDPTPTPRTLWVVQPGGGDPLKLKVVPPGHPSKLKCSHMV